jgi:hypothetical protein
LFAACVQLLVVASFCPVVIGHRCGARSRRLALTSTAALRAPSMPVPRLTDAAAIRVPRLLSWAARSITTRYRVEARQAVGNVIAL